MYKPKTLWGKRYKRYVDELKKLNKKTDQHNIPLSRKKFKEIWKASGNLASHKSKSVEMARSQVFPNAGFNVAKRLAKELSKAGFDVDMNDIRTGEISGKDIADMLNLGQVYHDKKNEFISQGLTQSEASQKAKEYVSWYYYGSN